jgi:hypothetical protein
MSTVTKDRGLVSGVRSCSQPISQAASDASCEPTHEGTLFAEVSIICAATRDTENNIPLLVAIQGVL